MYTSSCSVLLQSLKELFLHWDDIVCVQREKLFVQFIMHDYAVSISVMKCHMFCFIFLFVSANAVPSVELYFYDPYGTNGLVFVGDEGSLFCEAKDVSDPVFTLTFNGSQIFDGKNVAPEYEDRIQVEEAGTCLHINLTIADASLEGEYSCGVTSRSSSDNLKDTFRLQVFESPHCRDKGSRRLSNKDIIRLECIHLKNQTARLILFFSQPNQALEANSELVKESSFENNKVIEQYSSSSNLDEILNFTCKIGVMNEKSCNINITALLLTSQSDSMPKLTKVKSSTCKSNVSFGIITTDTTTQIDENLISSSSSVAPIPKKPANLLVIVLIPILILVIIIMLMLLLAFLIRRHKMNKDRIHRVAVNHAFGGSVSKLVHPTAQTDLVPISNPQADSSTSTYDSINPKPSIPDKDVAVTGEDSDPSGYVTQDEDEEVNAHTSSSEERNPHAIYQDDIGTANQEMASSNTKERVRNAVKDADESNGISEDDECNNYTEGNEEQSRPMSVIYSTVDKRRRRSNKEGDNEVNDDQSEERQDGTGTVGPNYMIVNKTHLQEEDIITTSPDDLSTGTNQQTELEVIYSKVDKKK